MAYLTYDAITLALTGVQWTGVTESAIEVTKEEALEFITGNKSLIDYQVILTSDGPKLARIEMGVPVSVFWTLCPILQMEGMDISIGKNHVSVKPKKPLLNPSTLFATLKDDPTWLVNSWDLCAMDRDRNGCIRIALNGAKNHDYYMSRAHEAKNS